MRKATAVGVICFGAVLAFAAAGDLHLLNARTGLWQVTETVTWTGLPPQWEAILKNGQPRSYKSCVKAEDLNKNPWADGSGEHCVWTVLNSTATDMEVRGTSCALGKDYGMMAEAHGKIHIQDPENGTGSVAVTLTGNGQTLNGHASYTGKWISASCPPNIN